MGARGVKGQIVTEYLDRWPDTPSLTLAKKVYAENTAVFKDTNNACNIIRYYRGQSGDRDRAKISDDYVKPVGDRNPFDSLPEGLTDFAEWEPHYVKGENILAIGDVHAPYHHREALQIALEYGQDLEIDSLLILGDFLDFYALSQWEKDPRRRNFVQELRIYREILDAIRQAFPEVEIVYKIGNHEERYERYMKVKAPELLDVEEFQLERVLHLKEYNVVCVSDKRIVKVGKYLNCIHGHEFGRSISSPVNPARGLYLRGKEISLAGHHHQTSQHTEKSMTGDIVSCWSLGCLCDLRPEYLPINKWNHGFATIQRNGNKFRLDNHRIIDGKVY